MKRIVPAIATAMILAGCAGTPEPTAQTPTVETSPLIEAADSCSLPDESILDDGKALQLDGGGKDDMDFEDGKIIYPEGKLEQEVIFCVLDTLSTPESTIALMEQTRALDGTRTDTADGLEYTWTYHPDSGLDVIITAADDA